MRVLLLFCAVFILDFGDYLVQFERKSNCKVNTAESKLQVASEHEVLLTRRPYPPHKQPRLHS